MTKINGETHIIGLFGATYKTSKMYAMYNAAFEASTHFPQLTFPLFACFLSSRCTSRGILHTFGER